MKCCGVKNVDSHLTYLPPTIKPAPHNILNEQNYQSTNSHTSNITPREQDKLFFESLTRPSNLEEIKIYKFQCPICSLFFKRILQCVKCKNYICIECIKNIKDFAFKS